MSLCLFGVIVVEFNAETFIEALNSVIFDEF